MPTVSTFWFSFLSGAVCVLCLVAALLFTRFYLRTKDRLFVLFAVAFAILGLNNVLFMFTVNRYTQEPEQPGHPLVYLPRLVAFGLILFAVIDKNRSRTPPGPPA
ncbi:MAG TPA: DUF5985 family protein [Phycisphaerae bacterium]|nr:DUF5985 family protein [Phycisphaerae bacterium]